MHVTARYSIFAPGRPGTYAEVATIRRDFDADDIGEVASRCRSWIAINRAGNPDHQLRFKAFVDLGEGKAWCHDETRGDPLIEPQARRVTLTLPVPLRKNG